MRHYVKVLKLPFLGEAGSSELRLESFNALNRTNFDNPVTGLTNPTFRTIDQCRRSTHPATSRQDYFLKAIFNTLLVLFLSCAGQSSVAARTNNPTADKLNSIFAPLAVQKGPGFAVLVRRSGRNVFERGYGVRDFRTLVKIDSVTDFRLASFTKQFTAMTIMLLVHDGKLTTMTR